MVESAVKNYCEQNLERMIREQLELMGINNNQSSQNKEVVMAPQEVEEEKLNDVDDNQSSDTDVLGLQ